jgi:hypothetical protein
LKRYGIALPKNSQAFLLRVFQPKEISMRVLRLLRLLGYTVLDRAADGTALCGAMR